jgi:hypothetical protein
MDARDASRGDGGDREESRCRRRWTGVEARAERERESEVLSSVTAADSTKRRTDQFDSHTLKRSSVNAARDRLTNELVFEIWARFSESIRARPRHGGENTMMRAQNEHTLRPACSQHISWIFEGGIGRDVLARRPSYVRRPADLRPASRHLSEISSAVPAPIPGRRVNNCINEGRMDVPLE